MLNSNVEDDFDLIINEQPRDSLLKRWAHLLKEGARYIEVYKGGQWYVAIPRGNKRVIYIPVDLN